MTNDVRILEAQSVTALEAAVKEFLQTDGYSRIVLIDYAPTKKGYSALIWYEVS